MGVGSYGQIVVTGIQNIGLGAVGIVSCQVTLVHQNLNCLSRAGFQNTGLAETDQLHSSLFNLVFLVIVGVGRLGIDLHGLLACHLTVVGHSNSNLKLVGLSVIDYLHITVIKSGIAQSEAEGERHVTSVGIAACVTGAHNKIFVPGLVILVTYIDAFLVDQVGLCIVGDILAIVTGIGHRNGILHCRRREVVIAVGIHQRTGGIDLAGQDVRHRIGAVSAYTADPQHCIHCIFVFLQEFHLQSIGGVDQHDNGLDLAIRLHLRSGSHHFLFVFIQRQVVGVAIFCTLGICTLTADTGDGDDGSIAVLGEGVLHILSIDAPGRFADVERTQQCGRFTLAITAGILCALTGEIEIPQGGIDHQTGFFQRDLQAICLGGIHVAGTGTTVDNVNRACRHRADLCALCQRQRAVIHQQRSTFCFQLVADLGAGF